MDKRLTVKFILARFVVFPGLQLLLLLFLLYSAAAAAPGNSGVVGSFTTQETQNFWSSEGGLNYTFGFKSVGGGDYLLSIWHSMDASQTAIWWADFGDNHTSTLKEGATFNYNTSSAILQLYDSTLTLVWQCCPNFSGSTTRLRFLDSGNLRLLMENGPYVIWESFKDPRDSLMLVGLENMLGNFPYLLQSRANRTSYARGRYHLGTYYDGRTHGQLFGMDALNNQYLYMTNFLFTIADGELVFINASSFRYASKTPYLERLSLDYDANLRVYRWFSDNSTWVRVWDMIVFNNSLLRCRAQVPCGPFGICTVDSADAVECSCPVGYEPISSDDPSKGCNSTRMPHGCRDVGGTDTSIMVQQPGTLHMFNYNADIKYLKNISIEKCKSLCLNECACVAVIYLSSKCWLKGNTTIGYWVNAYRTPTGQSRLLVKLLQFPTAASKSVMAKKGGQIIAVVTTVGAVTLAVGVGVLTWWARSGSNNVVPCLLKPDTEALDGGLLRFHYRDLVEATNNFTNLLGEGGFGKVYKGWLRETKGLQLLQGYAASNQGNMVVVAIKLLKQRAAKSGDDSQEKQFEAEMGTLSKIHHLNLVRLLGYCKRRGRGGEKRLLVYEYMENGSLDRYLSPTHMQVPLPWSTRFSIAVGTARGIAYLHRDCHPRILHCDIKPQNVLLNAKFTPKVADFGLAKHFVRQDQSHLSMPGMRGTRGYMAPEWLKRQGVTSKVDVYSFGMVLLELVHGLNTFGNDHMSLIEWAFKCLAAGSLLSDDHIEMETMGHAADAVPSGEILAMEVHTNGVKSHPTHVDNLESGNELQQQLHMLRVALWCVNHLPTNRPSMSHVLQLFEGSSNIDNPPNLADPIITNSILADNGSNLQA